MLPIRPRRAFHLVGILALAACLLASGCGQTRAGAAALVGEQRISVNELSQSVNATVQAAAEQQLQVRDRSALVRSVLSRQIVFTILEEAADRKGVTVTRGDVDEWIAQRGGRQRLEAQVLRSGVAPGELREFVRHRIMQQRLARALGAGSGAGQGALVGYLRKVARDMGVTVSPRYGQFSVQRLGVTEEGSDLSTPDPGSGAGAGGPGTAGSGSGG